MRVIRLSVRRLGMLLDARRAAGRLRQDRQRALAHPRCPASIADVPRRRRDARPGGDADTDAPRRQRRRRHRPSLPPAPTATPDDGAQVIEVELADSLTIDPEQDDRDRRHPGPLRGHQRRVPWTTTSSSAATRSRSQREAGTGEPGKTRFIAVPPGETVELTLTFDEAGKTIAGCTIAGHYSNGMKASITIKEP